MNNLNNASHQCVIYFSYPFSLKAKHSNQKTYHTYNQKHFKTSYNIHIMTHTKTPIIALFEPEIPQNTGTIIRTCAAFNLPLFIIHPCSFVFDNKLLKRSAMDYIQNANIVHMANFDALLEYATQNHNRIIATKLPKNNNNTPNTHIMSTNIISTGIMSTDTISNPNTLSNISLSDNIQSTTLQNQSYKTFFYHSFDYHTNDIILFGKESSGLPDTLDTHIHSNIYIPMASNARSLNLSTSVSIIAAHIIFTSNESLKSNVSFDI